MSQGTKDLELSSLESICVRFHFGGVKLARPGFQLTNQFFASSISSNNSNFLRVICVIKS